MDGIEMNTSGGPTIADIFLGMTEEHLHITMCKRFVDNV